MPAAYTLDIRSYAPPEFKFSISTGIYQGFFSDQQSRTDVNCCRKPGKQHERDNSDDANRAKPKIESIGYSGAHAEDPASIAITIESS
jgi:hypothetical protein